MGLFKKKEKKMPKQEELSRLPEIPILPELPEFRDTDEYSNAKIAKLSQLPSFPNNQLGNKFSQDSIKDAVTGKKEVEGDADDFAMRNEMQMMQNPSVKEEKDFYSMQEHRRTQEVEPLFIRIDNFEDSAQAFDESKKQILEMERLFNDLKSVKENEEREIKTFEEEIKQIKEKLDKIDKNIFSKIG